MKRVLITGLAGFIGSSLVDFIERYSSSYEVYGIDIRPKKTGKRYFKGDVGDRSLVKKVLKKVRPHYIFHLVGSTNTRDFRGLISVNVSATQALLDAIAEIKDLKTRVVVPGSAAEYGRVLEKDMPVKESHSLSPINPYGVSKMHQVLLALSYSEAGLDVVIGRIFNVLGWGTPRDFSIGRFAYETSLIKRDKKKACIETRGLSSERDFLDIKDVCAGLIAIAEKGKKGNVYNICSGKAYKIKNALDYLLKAAGLSKVKIKTSRSFNPEVRTIRGSNTKIIKHTKWRPEVNIRESLQKTFDYYNRRI